MHLLASLVFTVFVAQNPARDARLPAAAPVSTIRGRVLTDAGQPIRKARVGLAAEGHDEGWPVFTDAYGRYQFSGLTPGRYILTVSKAGYVTTRFGARQPLEPPVALELAPGTSVDNVDVRLAKGAAINGRLLDENGDPVIESEVSAGRLIRSANGLRTVSIKSTTTDDLGDYRLSELPTGSYVVVADPDRSFMNQMRMMGITGAGRGVFGLSQRGPALSKMYYPSAISETQAQILSLQPGEELTGIDMMLRSVTLPQLTIAIADSSGTPSPVRYELTADGRTDETLTASGIIRNGEPEVLSSSPGGWNLLVSGRAGGAYVHFTMGESDMTLPVTLKPFVTVSGRLLFDGRSSGDPRFGIEVVPRGSRVRGPAIASTSARPNPDGTFSVDAVSGPMEIRLRNPPVGWTLQSVSVGGGLLTDTWLDVGTDPITGVTLKISTQPTTLSGTVSDSSGRLLSGDSVIVFPKNAALLANPDRWARWIKPDLAGHFAIRDLPEGEFYVVALRDVDDASWETPAYLDALRPQATPVTLSVGRAANVSLTVKTPQ